MNSEEARKLLHAYVDGELDPATVLRLEAALAADASLRAAHDRLRAMSAAIREKADYHAAPAGLAASILRSAEPRAPAGSWIPPRRRWLVPAAAFAAAGLAALAVFRFHPGTLDSGLERELLASHGRAVVTGHVIEVASSDRHTVKPWLSARLAYSPPVVDLAGQGFPLAGGRLDYVEGRPVAVLVYARRKHSVEAYVWPGEQPARVASRDGINLRCFSGSGTSWCLVSDVPQEELAALAADLSRVPAGD